MLQRFLFFFYFIFLCSLVNSLLRPDRRQGGVVMLGCVWEPSCLFSFLSFRYLGVLFVHRTSLSFSRTQKDREIKWCRVSPRGLNVSARARASYFFVVALNNVGQTHASSRTNDSHTHPRKKKQKRKQRSLSRGHRVNLTRLHASLTIAVLDWVSEIPSILHGTH